MDVKGVEVVEALLCGNDRTRVGSGNSVVLSTPAVASFFLGGRNVEPNTVRVCAAELQSMMFQKLVRSTCLDRFGVFCNDDMR